MTVEKNVKERVVRNLTRSIAAMAILAPASAYSLGIGDIKLHSTLNQNLNAEIALLMSANETISDVNVRLASPDKFDEAGVPWIYFLSKIKFKLVTKVDGSSVIKLSSNEALREPFLDFLVEISWAKGSLYREFTVLVDPPAAYTQPIVPIVNKAEQIENEAGNKFIETIADNVAPIVQYGPVRSADSLWKIAKQTNLYADVSIEQMMIAIYEANPRAFYKENVNALMAGKTLDIPTREAILSLSKKEALSQFRKQNNAWNGRVTSKAKNEHIDSATEGVSTQLELEAPVEEEIIESAVIAESEPIINKGDEEQGENTKGFVTNSSDQNQDLLARLEKLEKNLVLMQKMIALKDEQLASLQNQENIKTNPQIKSPETGKVQLADKSVDSQKIAQVSKPIAVAAEQKIVKPKLTEEPESGFFSDLLIPILSIVSVIILALLGLLWSRKRKFENEIDTDTESMFATASEISLPETSNDSLVSIMEDAPIPDVGTVGESSFLSEFTPSDFDAFDTDQNEVDPVSEADVYLAYGRYQQAEDIMRQALVDQPERDECKLKLLEIFYANEDKSAFEEFAAELVSSGKHKDPEFWEKVVEMGVELAPESSLFVTTPADFNATENTGNSESLDLSETGETPPDALDFDLSNFDDSKETAEKTEIDDLDFDLSVFDEDGESAKKEEVNDLDFDLSIFDEDEEEAVEQEQEEVNDLDLSVGQSDLSQDVEEFESLSDNSGLEISENTVEEAIQQLDTEIDTIESFDLDIAEIDKKSIDTESDAGNDVNEEIESLEYSLDSVPSETTELEANELTTELDDIEGFDFDLDTEIKTESSSSDALDSLDMGVSDLTDMDELETKIDLAKAYIDMGDVEAAMGIVDEVKEKGNDEQKATVQAIIDQLK